MPIAIPLAMGVSAAAGLGSAAIGAHASKTAAQQQSDSAEKALNFQEQVYGDQKANQAPFVQAGQQSIAQLMQSIQNGTFGQVSNAPQFQGGTFKAPTLEEARATPGYEFTREQGSKGILEGSAATGGAISGGTLRSLDQFGSNLADTTYGDVFNRALSTYNAGLNQYAAQLQGFGAQQGAQQQAFGQLLAPAQLGEGATQSINNTGTVTAQNVGNYMTQQGNAQAAGTVGSANAITNGIGQAAGGISSGLTLPMILQALGRNGTPNITGEMPANYAPNYTLPSPLPVSPSVGAPPAVGWPPG